MKRKKNAFTDDDESTKHVVHVHIKRNQVKKRTVDTLKRMCTKTAFFFVFPLLSAKIRKIQFTTKQRKKNEKLMA